VDPVLSPVVLLAVAASFLVSAAAGFGGSLILVPTLALILGTKEGAALAALLLAANNVVKVFAYRGALPFRRASVVIVLTIIGAAAGALLLVAAPERVVTAAVICSFVVAFAVERLDLRTLRRAGAPLLALGSGLTSGFSGTSGPLKGLAVRGLELDRQHVVGALSLVSLVGDATKTAIWADAGLITGSGYLLALAAIPLMVVATMSGRRLNSSISERAFTGLFWTVMVGYTARLLAGF
jgi:uncharacterized membrane protein YfcA